MLYTVSVGPLALNMPVYMMQHRRGIIRTVLNGSLGEKKTAVFECFVWLQFVTCTVQKHYYGHFSYRKIGH
jgi:hypothetical protein